ncbi:MAG: M50 family metallopeptidase [Candidatus Limnocylindrales bacterium]
MVVLQSAITVVIFLVMLGTLVIVHELGHFVTARLAGIRILEFGIGFPPRARVLGQRGETVYTLNWLPIGGFVKLEGEDGDSDDPRSFVRARLPTKLLVLIAGVGMNLILAFVIFFGIAWLASPEGDLTVGTVEPASPAATAGLAAGDTLRTIDGAPFDYLDGPQQATATLRARAGQTVTVGVVRAVGGSETVAVTLRDPAQIDLTHGALGIRFKTWGFTGSYLTRDPANAVGVAAQRTVGAFRLILDGLGSLVGSIARNPTVAPPVTGPVGIAVQVGDVFWQLGPIFTLYLAGILSANLALVNILPFPPLDGGRMAVLLLQGLVGNRISQTAERLTYFVGFVVLFGFLIWVTYFDIARQVTGGASP